MCQWSRIFRGTPDSGRRPGRARRRRAALGRMLPGVALCAFGAGMWVLGRRASPAWLGGHVGPGLMAQLLAMGVIGLGAVWAALCARTARVDGSAIGGMRQRNGPTPRPACATAHTALLGAVLAFALVLPLRRVSSLRQGWRRASRLGGGGAHRARACADRRGADGSGWGVSAWLLLPAHRPALARPLRAGGRTLPPGPRSFCARADAGEPRPVPDGRGVMGFWARLVGVLAGIGPAATLALLLPADLRAGTGGRADHAGRDLLRRTIRRLDQFHLAEPAGRMFGRGDGDGRAQDGVDGPGRAPRWRSQRWPRSSRGW